MKGRFYKNTIIAGLGLAMVLCLVNTAVFAKKQRSGANHKTKNISKNQKKNLSLKGAKVLPGPFRVKEVKFQEVQINGKARLASAVVFNREINPATVQQNLNIRMLKKDANHNWRDASTHGNIVKVRPTFITWVCGAELETAVYIMHLRGTIKSKDGVYLDCDGDGKGEGGYLPAYESKMYNAVVKQLIPIDPDNINRF